jgi:hypothetical protein
MSRTKVGPEGLAEANVYRRAPSIGWLVVSLIIAIIAMSRATTPLVTPYGVWPAILAHIGFAISDLASA